MSPMECKRKQSKSMTVTIIGIQSPDAEQRISAAFGLIFGSRDLVPKDASDMSVIRGRKNEKPAIEKTVKKQE